MELIKRTKRQRNLIIVFFVVLIVTILILYFGYFKKEKSVKVLPQEIITPEREIVLEKKIEIDFSVFENPILKELQPIEKISSPNQEEIGKENPFSSIK
jgi:hypothetical protein